VVDAAMTDGASLLMAAQYGLMAKGFWKDQRERNFLDGAAHFYTTYACADGKHVSVGAIEPQFYNEFLERCNITDPEFQSQWRDADWPRLQAKLAVLFKTKTRAQWCELFEGSDACFAPVLSMQEAADHPHNAARGTFIRHDGVVQPAPAPRFDRTPAVLPPPAPRAGEHTQQVLRFVGLDDSEIEELFRAGVAQSPLS
jgi:alpha-methylacyl-CoA racemase